MRVGALESLQTPCARKIVDTNPTKCAKVNNTPNSYKPTIKDKHKEFITSLVIGNEFGDDGVLNHSHCHGYIKTKNKVKFAAVQQYFTEVLKLPRLDDLERPKDVQKAIRYCTKDDEFAVVVGVDIAYTSLHYKAYRYSQFHNKVNWRDPVPSKVATCDRKLFCQMVEEFSQSEKEYSRMIAMKDLTLRPWQRAVYNLLNDPPDDRTVTWIFDRDGDTGKSVFAKYISSMNPKCLRVENVPMWDIALALDDHNIIIFDLPRQKDVNINFKYAILEQLKNGHIFSPKYQSKEKIFGNVHVVVMCNYLPEKKQLTLDRWKVLALTKVPNSVFPVQITRLWCFNNTEDCPDKNCLCQNSVLTIRSPEKTPKPPQEDVVYYS